ncbi:translocation protein SEC62 [Hippocampus zosterae]|uniref:translocation protein SEC62 n=1 Tax=Hippocampus zosterae TaxID=109293 RepID=UPI00223D7F87|nr:translocation protein SEC62 [Hippocampus zosterae]
MAERRRHKKRIQEVSEPTKEEKAVAKYMRFNCPTKSTNMMGQRVDYFTASKAVDCLLDSKWAKAKKGEEAVFTTRDSVLDYCNRLLKKQFFHRALKVMKKKIEKDAKKDKKSKGDSGKEEDKKGKKDKDKKKEVTDAGEAKKDKSDDSPKKKKEVKKKFKLELHEEQLFLDGNEVYVWIYDPVHFKTFAMGLVLVIAVIAATLFPLWPAEMRVGVYYLSVAAGCFVASILLLAIARCILFLLIWLVTGGRHHFWFLPNLTADVGFIDSFRPLYTHEYKGPRGGGAGKKAKEDKDAGGADEARKSDSDDNKSDSEKKDEEEEEDEEDDKERKSGEEEEEEEEERRSDTDSERKEEEGSQHSNGNDFEMITREELDQHTEEDEDEDEEDKEEERKDTQIHVAQS